MHMLGFQAFPFILFLGIRRRSREAQHPVKELCFSEDGYWPSFAPLEEVGGLKVSDAASQSSADWGNGVDDIGSPARHVK